MCSYLTVNTEIAGSAKGAQGWFSVKSANVYFDHPFHAPFAHTLNIDFADPSRGPGRARGRRAERGVGPAPGRQHRGGLGRRRGRRLVTTPTAPAAGVHLPWARVPEAVQAWAARLGGGGPPAAVRDLSGGFSPGATSVLEWPDGRAFFVKAVGAELNPDSPVLHRREIRISTALPPSARASHGCATATTMATGWRWPSMWWRGGHRAIPGMPASSTRC